MPETAEAAMAAETSKSKDADKDAARRQRERVERLLAQPEARASGHVTLADGRVLDYTLGAAFLPVPGKALEAAEPDAAVMTTHYVMPGVVPAARPVCFAFNGGPGSASIRTRSIRPRITVSRLFR